MLAAGWGGTGSIDWSNYIDEYNSPGKPEMIEVEELSFQNQGYPNQSYPEPVREIASEALNKLIHPTRSRRLKQMIEADSDMETFIESLNKIHFNVNKLSVSSIIDLRSFGLRNVISEKLAELNKMGVSENSIVVIFQSW